MAYPIASFATFAAALLASLVLASLLTPARWWRRPNLKALTVLVAGTWGIGSLLLALAPAAAHDERAVTPAVAGVAVAQPVPAAALAPLHMPAPIPATFIVVDDLNLRARAGVQAARLALVPAGASVTTTGRREGDWWQVRTGVGARAREGWVSSLWLRRAQEAQQAQQAQAQPRRTVH